MANFLQYWHCTPEWQWPPLALAQLLVPLEVAAAPPLAPFDMECCPLQANHNSFRCFVVLLDDFQVQGSSVDSLEVGVGTFHNLFLNWLVESGNEELGLVEKS